MDKFKILLVDDEEEFIETLSNRLQMRDLNSELAMNGEEAIQIVHDQEPDVMVLDLKMPGIDGIEVLRRVRKTFPHVQVIILTGHGSQKDKEEVQRLGAFEYLTKPVDIEQLVQTMKAAFKKKLETLSVAAAFAEAGDFDTARQMMEEEKEENSKRKKKKGK